MIYRLNKNKDKIINAFKRPDDNYQLNEGEFEFDELKSYDIVDGVIIDKWTQQDTANKLSEVKTTKIAELKESLKAQVKEAFFDLDNTKTRDQLVTIAKNRFTTKKAEINALTTIEEVNNYQLT